MNALEGIRGGLSVTHVLLPFQSPGIPFGVSVPYSQASCVLTPMQLFD